MKAIVYFIFGVIATSLVWVSLFAFTDIFDKAKSEEVVQETPEEEESSENIQELIVGDKWYLETMNSEESTANIFIEFDPLGNATGFSGCNDLSTSYEIKGTSITILKPVTTTLKLCIEGGEEEVEFTTILQEVDKISATEDILVLSSDEDTLVFNKEKTTTSTTSSNIAGTWQFAAISENEVATSLVEGTTVSIVFSPDGSISGEACNSFGGNYIANEEDMNLAISNLISTKKACIQPVGIMEQEDAILANLSSATRYEMIENAILRVFYSENSYIEFMKGL